MGKVFPPLKIDIAGALYVPFMLRDARRQYQDGRISWRMLCAVEGAGTCDLTERLKSQSMQTATDGGFRSYDFLEGREGIRCKDSVGSLSGGELEITGRISSLHHPVLDDFVSLVENIAEDMLPKQHIPSPGKLPMRILRKTETGYLRSIYPDLNLLLDDLAAAYKNLLEKLYEAGYRCVQFEDAKSILTDEAARLNNRVLRERPKGLSVAFHATTDILIRLYGVDAYFLNYDYGTCDRSRLLWFVREWKAVFGFVLSYYPDEEELDELQVKMGEALNYILVKHLMLCPPGTDNLLNSSEEGEVKQWKTVELTKDVVTHIFFV